VPASVSVPLRRAVAAKGLGGSDETPPWADGSIRLRNTVRKDLYQSVQAARFLSEAFYNSA